jgi:AmmeMemoRadiSam system protein B
MEGWLEAPPRDAAKTPARAIIAPHAGFSYSGPAAAFAYAYIQPASVKRVFLLGPSHKYYLDGCALSGFARYDTPVGSGRIDAEVYAALAETGRFEMMTASQDENEHSMEMHMPYIAQVMKANESYTLVPILVGSIGPEKEKEFAEVLAPYLADPANLFVISSDFCHWGSRFSFQHFDPKYGPICKSIEALDKRGMAIIESVDPAAFTKYLEETRNTICGRHPIGVLLSMLDHPSHKGKFSCTFTRYEQSSSVMSKSGSSVSYASAVIVAK